MADENHQMYITVTEGFAGWFAVMMWWNDQDLDFPFWEPWTTGVGRYVSKALAEEEAKIWAEIEGLEYRQG